MRHKKHYLIPQGGKVGNHILIEHLDQHSSKAEYPMAKFKCGQCGEIFTTSIMSAFSTQSCNCAKLTHHIDVNKVLSILRKDPFIKVRSLADKLEVSYSTAWTHRTRAFRLL